MNLWEEWIGRGVRWVKGGGGNKLDLEIYGAS